MKRPFIVGNWKMNGSHAEALRLAQKIRKGMKNIKAVEVALAPPFTALGTVVEVTKGAGGAGLWLAAQNVHWEEKGAFTGEISPKMLRETGCRFVIIGHSERRHLFHESDSMVARKIISALHWGLLPILCVGETLKERRSGSARRVISRQLRAALKGLANNAIDRITVAYEPVWAIGTGHHASADQVRQAHRWIRDTLRRLFGSSVAAETRILYGGSVRPDNATDLAGVSDVDGLLVGGASLKADDFLRIIHDFKNLKAGKNRRP